MSTTTRQCDVVAVKAAESLCAPFANRFPDVPASWYFVCRSNELRSSPVAAEISGRRLAIFRGLDGTPVALEADCSHAGADLSRGRLVNGCLQCPFHGWEYAADGRCVRIPVQSHIPAFARQKSFATAERHGLVFAFLGAEPLFPLPQFFEPTTSPLIASAPARYAMDCSWYVFGANGFDLQHFALVHDRQLIGEAQVDCPAPFARRIRFKSRVVGTSSADRLIRNFVGDEVDVSITAWAGNLVAVTAYFRRAVSRVLFSISPESPTRTRSNLFVLVEQGHWSRRWMQPLELWIRRSLTLAFLRGDIQDVRRAVYRPTTMIEADRVMIDYYRWLAALPLSEKETE